MQPTHGEHNHRPLGLLLGTLLAAAAVWLCTAPRYEFGPPPAEILHGMVAGVPLAVAWTLAAMAALALTVPLLLWLPHGRQAGGYGAAAACLLATGLPLWLGSCGDLDLGVQGIAATAGLAVVLAVATAPLLRDRGPASLLLVPLLVGAPLLAARWQYQSLAVDAAVLQGVRELVPAGAGMVAIQFDPTCSAADQRVLLASLRPPWAPRPPRLLPVAGDSAFADWLLRMGLPALRFDRQRAVAVPAMPLAQQLRPGLYRVEAQFDRSGPALDLWVRGGKYFAGGTALLFSEAGCLAVTLDDRGASLGGGADHQALRQLLASLPSAAWIRVLVVSRADAESYGWIDLGEP